MSTPEAVKNHAKAPQSAAFVQEMRKHFGEVAVLFVKERDFEIGKRAKKGEPRA